MSGRLPFLRARGPLPSGGCSFFRGGRALSVYETGPRPGRTHPPFVHHRLVARAHFLRCPPPGFVEARPESAGFIRFGIVGQELGDVEIVEVWATVRHDGNVARVDLFICKFVVTIVRMPLLEYEFKFRCRCRCTVVFEYQNGFPNATP